MTPTTLDPSPTVSVIGLGYIGLPTAAVLAMHGVQVIGVDVNAETVDAVNRGEVPFVEPDLEIAVSGAVSRGRLHAETKTPSADVFIVAVPTPFTGEHLPDLSYIEAAADGIAPRLQGGELVILESTSPPGTTRHMAERILADRPDLSLDGSEGRPTVHFAHCPERVMPGRIMIELVTNDRIVGGLTRQAAERARDLYRAFCQGNIMLTDATTAETAKLVENSYRDVNIAFANELAAVADRLDIDVWELINLANHHPRVNILHPGPGVGGHCIAVDPWFVVASAPREARLIRAAREINDSVPERIVNRAVQEIRRRGSRRVLLYGLTYKADVDDVRNSPGVEIARSLAERLPGAVVQCIDPYVAHPPAGLVHLENVLVTSSPVSREPDDYVLVLMDHTQFRDGWGLDGGVDVDLRPAWGSEGER